eukprot:Seg6117.1 transcript_id=Seg6117.1/GoldUCD/mRNA.D3Y31 product="hypothetical protein" pseudo=true protein_id=Seg6117.1/GoldUCD/D3Y31
MCISYGSTTLQRTTPSCIETKTSVFPLSLVDFTLTEKEQGLTSMDADAMEKGKQHTTTRMVLPDDDAFKGLMTFEQAIIMKYTYQEKKN